MSKDYTKKSSQDSDKLKSTVKNAQSKKRRIVYQIKTAFSLIVKIGKPRTEFFKINQVINGSHPAYSQLKALCDEGDARIIAIEK